MTEKDKLGRAVMGNLPAEFRADGASRTGDEDNGILQIIQPLLTLDGNRVTPEEILHSHLAGLGNADAAIQKLINAGDGFVGYLRVLAQLHRPANGFSSRGWHGDDGLLGLVSSDDVGEVFQSPKNGQVLNFGAFFVGIVINKANGFQP